MIYLIINATAPDCIYEILLRTHGKYHDLLIPKYL